MKHDADGFDGGRPAGFCHYGLTVRCNRDRVSIVDIFAALATAAPFVVCNDREHRHGIRGREGSRFTLVPVNMLCGRKTLFPRCGRNVRFAPALNTG